MVQKCNSVEATEKNVRPLINSCPHSFAPFFLYHLILTLSQRNKVI